MLALKNCVQLGGDLRFVDSDAEFEGIDDAPFCLFAVNGLDLVGVDEAGFHDGVYPFFLVILTAI